MKTILLTAILMAFTQSAFAADNALATKDAVVTKYDDFDAALRAAYKARESGDWADAENALNQGFDLATSERRKSEIQQLLMTIYSKTDRPDLLFESAEYVAKYHPHPASVSITIRSLITSVRRLEWQTKLTARYEAALQENPKDRVALTIMEGYEYLVTRNYAKRRHYIDRMISLDKEEGRELNAEMHRNRAFMLRLERKYVESAQAYEEIADLDEPSRAYSLMFAAENWQRAKDKTKALAAAERADEMGPGARARKSLYQWHRSLGEVFLCLHQRERAIKHLAAAKEDAAIDAYRDQCSELLDLANALK